MGIYRPYSATRVVMLRHSQRREYASSTQAMKLWNILQEHLKNGTHELTYGATDPVVIGQMAKYQQVCRNIKTRISQSHRELINDVLHGYRQSTSPAPSAAQLASWSPASTTQITPGTLSPKSSIKSTIPKCGTTNDSATFDFHERKKKEPRCRLSITWRPSLRMAIWGLVD